MKKILLLLLLIVHQIVFSQQDGQSSHIPLFKPSKENEKGKVKSVHISVYDMYDKSGELVKGTLQKYYTQLYNIKGGKIQEIHYNGNGSIIEKYIFDYNENGKLIAFSKFDSSGKLYKKTVHK